MIWRIPPGKTELLSKMTRWRERHVGPRYIFQVSGPSKWMVYSERPQIPVFSCEKNLTQIYSNLHIDTLSIKNWARPLWIPKNQPFDSFEVPGPVAAKHERWSIQAASEQRARGWPSYNTWQVTICVTELWWKIRSCVYVYVYVCICIYAFLKI